MSWHYNDVVATYNRIPSLLGGNTDFQPKLTLLVSIIDANYCTEKKENLNMKLRLLKLAVKLQQIAKDTKGQDLIEYALMAGFVAVAAGAIMPGVASSINVVFSKVNSIMITAASS
jgi:pilus assembly protein Flp/PilA